MPGSAHALRSWVEEVAEVDFAEEGGTYWLHHLTLFDPVDQPVSERTFEDLLIHQLAEEVTELVAVACTEPIDLRRAEWLESLRGQLDFARTDLPGRHDDSGLALH